MSPYISAHVNMARLLEPWLAVLRLGLVLPPAVLCRCHSLPWDSGSAKGTVMFWDVSLVHQLHAMHLQHISHVYPV